MLDILSACNVSFRSAIKYPEINIISGKTTFIQGKSGSGKSTLLKLFNGTLSPDSGHLYYYGTDFEALDMIQLRQEVLLVSQSVYLFQGTIEENFKEYYAYRELDPISQESMRQYLGLCCADFSLDSCCQTMSGGERQRIFIAICLSFMPKVLMLDEPTSALDERTAQKLLMNIKQFCDENNITLVVISHDNALANIYADNVIWIEREVQ